MGDLQAGLAQILRFHRRLQCVLAIAGATPATADERVRDAAADRGRQCIIGPFSDLRESACASFRPSSCIALAVATAGCGILYRQPIYQGNLIEKTAVDQLQAGMSKQQVMALLGTPSIADPFHHDRWDYTATRAHRPRRHVPRSRT